MIEKLESLVTEFQEIEKKLVAIWSRVLGESSEEIGINDNFFRLGGIPIQFFSSFSEAGDDPAHFFGFMSGEENIAAR